MGSIKKKKGGRAGSSKNITWLIYFLYASLSKTSQGGKFANFTFIVKVIRKINSKIFLVLIKQL